MLTARDREIEICKVLCAMPEHDRKKRSNTDIKTINSNPILHILHGSLNIAFGYICSFRWLLLTELNIYGENSAYPAITVLQPC
jgi:hypothetical protein